MALAVVSEMPSSAGLNSATSPFSYNFTCAAGSTLLLVGIETSSNSGQTTDVTSVTYNSVAMTLVPNGSASFAGGACKLKFYYLLNPTTGSSVAVAITWTTTGGTSDCISGAISFSGNDTTTPFRVTTFSASANDAGPAAVSATTTTVGNIVVDIAGTGASLGFTTPRSNTLSWAKNVSGSNAGDNAESTRAAGGGTVAFSHTLTAADNWGDLAVEVQADSGFATPRRFIGPMRMGPASNPIRRFRSVALGDPVPPTPDNAPADPISRGPFRGVGRFPVSRFRSPRLADAVSSGATQFTQAVDGTLTSSGLLVKQTGKILSGSLTSSGLLAKQTGKILAGSMASSGAIQKQTGKVLAGSMASSGAIVKQTQKPLSGSMASSGALVKQTQKVLAGTLTSAGALVKQAQKVLAGALTSSGLLVKQTNKILAGTLTSSGALTAFKVALISLAGTLTSSGTLVKQTGKNLAGTLTSAGTIVKLTAKGLAGSLASSGALIAQKTAAAARRVFIFLFED